MKMKSLNFVGDRERAAASIILNRLWNCLKREGDGLVYNDSWTFDGLVPVLSETIAFPNHWAVEEIDGCVRQALLKAKRLEEDESLDGFLRNLTIVGQNIEANSVSLYRMWTRVTLSGWVAKRPICFKIDGLNVQIRPTPPRSLMLQPFFVSGTGDINPNAPKGGVIILAEGKFRTKLQAGDGLHRAMAHLVGVINFSYRKWRSEWRSGKLRPKAKAIMGDYQYLFLENESLNKDMYWYNPDFIQEHWDDSNFKAQELAKLVPYVRDTISRIQRSPSGSVARSAIDMMAEGLGYNNPSQRILKTWTALEILLSRSKQAADKCTDIVERATFPFKDRELWKMRLNHAVKTRNKYVHRGVQSASAEAVSNGLDAVFCTIVHWTLNHSMRLQSHNDLINIFSLSGSQEILRRQISERRKALEILK